MNTNDLIQRAIKSVSDLLHNYQTSKNPKLQKNASILSYWLYDYVKMLKREETFNPRSLKRYKRGEIVKVHLGYNIGSEQGGLHYAIVLTKNDTKSSSAITIIPLSSVKVGKPLHSSNVFLGNTIFEQLMDKWKERYAIAKQELEEKTNELNALKEYADVHTEDLDVDEANALLDSDEGFQKRAAELCVSIQRLTKLVSNNSKITKEILKMKTGSVALVNQITTVSKIRIYNPLHSKDVLGNIKASDEILDLIDNKIKELYLGIE